MSQNPIRARSSLEEFEESSSASLWQPESSHLWDEPQSNYESNMDLGLLPTPFQSDLGNPSQQQDLIPSPDYDELGYTGLSAMWRHPSPRSRETGAQSVVSGAEPTQSHSRTVSNQLQRQAENWRNRSNSLSGSPDLSMTPPRSMERELTFIPYQPAVPRGDPSMSPPMLSGGSSFRVHQSRPQSKSPHSSISTSPISVPTRASVTPLPAQSSQHPSQNVTLVQLGASQNHLINDQPAPWVVALDVDRSYRTPRPPSPRHRPALTLYVRIPDYETYHRALYLRSRTVREFIRCVADKYGLSTRERESIRGVVLRTPIGLKGVDDADVVALRHETQMYLKCGRVRGERDVWQLEIS